MGLEKRSGLPSAGVRTAIFMLYVQGEPVACGLMPDA
jgi:hypothetical protein